MIKVVKHLRTKDNDTEQIHDNGWVIHAHSSLDSHLWWINKRIVSKRWKWLDSKLKCIAIAHFCVLGLPQVVDDLQIAVPTSKNGHHGLVSLHNVGYYFKFCLLKCQRTRIFVTAIS